MRTRRFVMLCALIVLTLTMLLPGAPQAVLATSSDGGMLQAASFPFSEGFEDETLGAEWSTSTSGVGFAERSENYPYTGSGSIYLGQRSNGAAEANLVLSIDLTGQTDIFLDFWHRETGNNDVGISGIYIHPLSAEKHRLGWKRHC